MPGRLRSRAVAPRLSRPAACFEHLIFANENRCNHQHEFLSNPAYRKFSGDCAWNPRMPVWQHSDTIAGQLVPGFSDKQWADYGFNQFVADNWDDVKRTRFQALMWVSPD